MGPAFAQEANPAAGECVAPEVPPGTPPPMEPEASPAAGDMLEATPEGEVEIAPDASPEISAGEPALENVVAEVEATVANLAICLNSGESVLYVSLHTAAGLLEECGTTNVHHAPMCWESVPPVSNVVVSNVQVQVDGRVSADVTTQLGSFLGHERSFFVPGDDGIYRLDSSPDLPVDVPEGATMIDGEMADYEFILSQASAPAGDIAFNVTNTGEYPHELMVLMLPEGIMVEDVFADESLFAHVQSVGFTFAMPGAAASPLVMVDLQPGTYTLVCFVDVPEGIPHVMRGMIAEFEVTEAESSYRSLSKGPGESETAGAIAPVVSPRPTQDPRARTHIHGMQEGRRISCRGWNPDRRLTPRRREHRQPGIALAQLRRLSCPQRGFFTHRCSIRVIWRRPVS